MRRCAGFAVAAAHALSFLVFCLGSCLAPDSPTDHGCCPTDTGISLVTRSCCEVVPGDGEPQAAVPVRSTASAPVADLVISAHPASRLVAPPAFDPSPPLVLRV